MDVIQKERRQKSAEKFTDQITDKLLFYSRNRNVPTEVHDIKGPMSHLLTHRTIFMVKDGISYSITIASSGAKTY